MSLGFKAANVKAPQKPSKNSDGSANTLTTVRLYTVTGASQSNALPTDWLGKYIRITAEGADLTYYLTDASGQTVSNLVTGTADGSSSDGTQLGGTIPSGTNRDIVVPYIPGGNGQIFFVRQGSANGNARIELASD